MKPKNPRPAIIAHRGASGLAPENTLAAFAKAIEVGADGVELDVQLTADRQVVVHHDFCLSKEWARRGGNWLAEPGPPIRDLTTEELLHFDVGRLAPHSKYQAQYPEYRPADGERVPTLRQVLTLIRDRAGPAFQIWLELKAAPALLALSCDPTILAEKALEEVERLGLTDQTTVISFYWPALYHAQRTLGGIKTGYLSAERHWLDNIQSSVPGRSPWTAPFCVDDYGGSIPRMIKAAGGCAWSVYWKDLTPERLADARKQGLQTGVWTIRGWEETGPACALGADLITTDRPDWFAGEMAE